MKRILITGGLGHIGSKLIRELGDCELVINDDLSTQRFCSLFNIGRDFIFWDKSFFDIATKDLEQFDAIIHLAAKTDAASSMKDKDLTLDTNVIKTKDFIHKAETAGVKLFIFPSSTSVYGKGQAVMYEHEDNTDPQSVYAESKIDVEKVLKESSMPHIVFRFGTIFGTSPGMRFHTAINKFCYQVSFNQPLTIWKENFNQQRPYLGINDAIQAINMALDEKLPINEIYNVLSCNTVLSEIVDTIQKYKKVNINFVDTPLLNQHSYIVNEDKIKKYGFLSSDNLNDAISGTLGLLGE